jgi:hypothetical protein
LTREASLPLFARRVSSLMGLQERLLVTKAREEVEVDSFAEPELPKSEP